MTTFTEEQAAALDALEALFGPTDESFLKNVTSRDGLGEYGYTHWINRSLKDSLIYWMQYKHALSVDWDAVERARKLELAKKLAERKAGVREAVVLGFMSGLLPKISRAAPEADVTFETNKETFELDVVFESFSHNISMVYDRETRQMYTRIVRPERLADGHTDDLTGISGNLAPAEQVKGYAAVVDYLDGLTVDTLP